MRHDNCSHYRMDRYLLDNDCLSEAEETALAEIELLILLLYILLVIFVPIVDRQRYPPYK